MKMFVFVFVLSVLGAVGQAKKVDGPCPIKIEQIETFDHDKYLGKWWDTYTDSITYGCTDVSGCRLTYYRGYYYDDHSFYVNLYYGYNYTGICSFGFSQPDYDVDARLFYDAYDNSYYILDTDFDSYTVEVGCANDDGLTHEERVVLRSRNKKISDEVRDKLVKKIVDYGFAEPDLVANDFTGCKDFDPDSWHIH